MWQKLAAKWHELDWARRLILLEAAWTLLAAQAAVHLLPFHWLTPGFGRLGESERVIPLTPAQVWQAQQIGWAVRALARHFPWDSKCLAQAITGKWMLQRRGLTSTLYLGVDHGKKNWLEAHAWLVCGNEILTGERQHERFVVIAAFTEEPR